MSEHEEFDGCGRGRGFAGVEGAAAVPEGGECVGAAVVDVYAVLLGDDGAGGGFRAAMERAGVREV